MEEILTGRRSNIGIRISMEKKRKISKEETININEQTKNNIYRYEENGAER